MDKKQTVSIRIINADDIKLNLETVLTKILFIIQFGMIYHRLWAELHGTTLKVDWQRIKMDSCRVTARV